MSTDREDRMAAILQTLYARFVAEPTRDGFGWLTREEERHLAREHGRHFSRRVRYLDGAFFPGGERSEEAVRSASNGAYGSFRREPNYSGHPAFLHTVRRQLAPRGFLYYWRASATIQYLKQNASPDLKHRLKLLRRVSAHLQRRCVPAGKLAGEQLWALDASPPARPGDAPERVTQINVDLVGHRGAALVQAVIEAAGFPLTRAEIASVLQRLLQERAPVETGLTDDLLRDEAEQHDRLLREEVVARARQFCAQMTEEERRMLVVRGFSEDVERLRPFRVVAERLGGRSAESFRLLERQLMRVFAERFPDREEATTALEVLRDFVGASVA